MSQPSERTVRAIAGALDFLEADPSQARSVATVASVAGVSRSTVNRVFAFDRRAAGDGFGLAKRWGELKRHPGPRARGADSLTVVALRQRISDLEDERDALLSLLYEREVGEGVAQPFRLRVLPGSDPGD